MTKSTQPIVIDLFETIQCPECGHQFALHKGISESTVKVFRDAYETRVQADSKKLAAVIAEEEKRKAEAGMASTVAALDQRVLAANEAVKAAQRQLAVAQQEAEAKAKGEAALSLQGIQAQLADANRAVADKEAALKRTQALVLKTQQDTKAAAAQENAVESKLLHEQLAAQKRDIGALRANELALRKEKVSLEQARAELELRVQRQLDQERAKISEDAARIEAEKGQHREAELRKKLEDVQHANDELTRKLAQGSQQLQGEVLELEIEARLAESYRMDDIQPVPNGTRGADVVQKVVTATGQIAGTIVWEAKRAAKWSGDWIQKLKRDAEPHDPTLSILVTTVMPKTISGAFGRIDGVYVISETLLGAFAEVARTFVLRQHQLALTGQATSDQMSKVFEYVVNGALGDRLNIIHAEAAFLTKQLEKERNYVQTQWKTRETHVRQLSSALNDVRGELIALCDTAAAKLALPAETTAVQPAAGQAKPASEMLEIVEGGAAPAPGENRESA